MDFEKLLQLSQDQLSEYFETFVTTLRNPHLKFLPVSASHERAGVLAPTKHNDIHTASRINPKLFIFVLISIFLGLTIASFVPGKKETPDIMKAIILVVVFWFAISCLLYLICKLLKGRGTFVETTSMSLQIFAVIFVVSNFVTLIWGVLIGRTYRDKVSFFDVFESNLTGYPLHVYLLAQLILLSIYLPIGMKKIHGFGRWRGWVFVALLSMALTAVIYFNFALYQGTGVAFYIPLPPDPAIEPILGKWYPATQELPSDFCDSNSKVAPKFLRIDLNSRGHNEVAVNIYWGTSKIEWRGLQNGIYREPNGSIEINSRVEEVAIKSGSIERVYSGSILESESSQRDLPFEVKIRILRINKIRGDSEIEMETSCGTIRLKRKPSVESEQESEESATPVPKPNNSFNRTRK